jgi:HEAT repeat protein
MVVGAVGVLATLLVARIGSAHSAGQSFANSDLSTTSAVVSSSVSSSVASAAAMDSLQLDGLEAQKQAESLLELAIGESAGAVDQISSRVDGWPGRLKWNSQIATLTTAALNSGDMRVRESGIEIELAAYRLRKNTASVDYLLKTAESSHHARKIWALWALGLMGNRGVETDRVVQALTSHLKDFDEDSRRWAVEGLTLVGSNQTIAPLLKTMHDDPSAGVRERAACGLAQSGMFTQEQRLAVIPELLRYTDDSTLDAQTHGLAFQALAEITRQRLPDDSAVWRNWYERHVASTQ